MIQELTRAYQKVVNLFKTNLANSSSQGNADSGSMASMTQDILILLLPYLSLDDADTLFRLCLSEEVLSSKDNGVQKRSYKILAKLVESGKVHVDDGAALFKQLDVLLGGASQAAKKVIWRRLYRITRY